MPALFKVRRSILGKCVLQKFSGDVVKGPPPGFRDVPWTGEIEALGGFTIVPREDYDRLTNRVADAERRSKKQRDARKVKRDFEASRMHGDNGE